MQGLAYKGLATPGKSVEVGGANGPVSLIPQGTTSLIVLEAQNFSEGDHERIKQLTGEHSSTARKTADLVDQIMVDLENDGRLDPDEQKQLGNSLAALTNHPELSLAIPAIQGIAAMVKRFTGK